MVKTGQVLQQGVKRRLRNRCEEVGASRLPSRVTSLRCVAMARLCVLYDTLLNEYARIAAQQRRTLVCRGRRNKKEYTTTTHRWWFPYRILSQQPGPVRKFEIGEANPAS
jgi:hypothetical protein